jgi:hypothetical protein
MLPYRGRAIEPFSRRQSVMRKFNLVIPALVAGILAGCSGGATAPDASGGAASVLAANSGSVTT